MSTPALLPTVDVDTPSKPFFAAAVDGRLLVQRCAACGTVQLGSELCNHCFGTRLDWQRASGKGTVHSFVVMHMAYQPGFAAPYRSVIVELEEGPRLPMLLDLSPDIPVAVGQAVSITFVPADADDANHAAMVPVARPLSA